jgi:hypothetical protein
MEKFLMCFIKDWLQVIEINGAPQEKRARPLETRPEPTIFGNCDSWNFIVGKKLCAYSRNTRSSMALHDRNEMLIHILFTSLEDCFLNNLWAICGCAVNRKKLPAMWIAVLLICQKSRIRAMDSNQIQWQLCLTS